MATESTTHNVKHKISPLVTHIPEYLMPEAWVDIEPSSGQPLLIVHELLSMGLHEKQINAERSLGAVTLTASICCAVSAFGQRFIGVLY